MVLGVQASLVIHFLSLVSFVGISDAVQGHVRHQVGGPSATRASDKVTNRPFRVTTTLSGKP